jgi:nucleotide-binding universal stress UspA family protein
MEASMIRSILMPLDGSRFSEMALPVALDLARKAHASLRLVMVHEPILAMVPAWSEKEDPEEHAHELEYLAGLIAGVDLHGAASTYEVIVGDARTALMETAEQTHSDLIVMATHGRGAFSRFWLGSVADHVMRHATVPVLLIRPLTGVGRTTNGCGYRNILVALDLSKASEAILEPVKAFARLNQGQLTLVNVVEPAGPMRSYPMPALGDPGRLEAQRTDAREHLDRLASQLRTEGLSVATRVVVGAGIATQLLDLLQKGHFDLMALTTSGAGGLQRALVGSVADKVVRGAEKPVLVLRPGVSPV